MALILELPNLIPADHKKRLHRIIDESWKIFQSHFLNNRHPILKEAPFQHHFANIISTIGTLYCVSRDDRFFVDLEAKCRIGPKNKFLDITCSFPDVDARCAIELKFKTAQQAAQDHGRIDAYADIAALEFACRNGYDFGRFYMITDSTAYVNKSKKGVGTRFCTHNQHEILAGTRLISDSKGREGIEVFFNNAYRFNWTKFNEWHFLEIRVEHPTSTQVQLHPPTMQTDSEIDVRNEMTTKERGVK
jgi:hypothetical protein